MRTKRMTKEGSKLSQLWTKPLEKASLFHSKIEWVYTFTFKTLCTYPWQSNNDPSIFLIFTSADDFK